MSNKIPFTKHSDIIRRDKAIKYYRLARYLAHLFSKDPSTKVGALFLAPKSFEILSAGYNGMPRGIDENRPERWERPLKYKLVEHAERNGMFNANRRGIALEGAIAIVCLFPCHDCARGLIQSGVSAVVTAEPKLSDDRWDESFAVSRELLLEAGIELILLTEDEIVETPIFNIASRMTGWRARLVYRFAELMGVPV